MNDSRQSKIYIFGTRRNQVYWFCGTNFYEFVTGLDKPINNLLLLKHEFEECETNYFTGFDYIEESQIDKLLSDDVTHYERFCWVDFEDVNSLEVLQPREIADLLYFAHKKEPISRPFLTPLKNRFAYIAENDISKVYFKQISDLTRILSNTIQQRLAEHNRRRFIFFQKGKDVTPVPYGIMEQFIPLMEEGLIICTESKEENRKEIILPIFVLQSENEEIDHFFEMQINEKASIHYADLVFNKKESQWSIKYK